MTRRSARCFSEHACVVLGGGRGPADQVFRTGLFGYLRQYVVAQGADELWDHYSTSAKAMAAAELALLPDGGSDDG